jgi:transporter family protein
MTSTSWLLWAALSAVFAALTAIFGKVGVSGMNSHFATLIRTVVILVVLAGFVAATGQLQPFGAVNRHSLLFLVLSGLATGASWVCYYRALKLGDAARVAPIDKMSVVLVAVFAALFLGERPSGMNWAGVGLIALGAVLVAL